MKEKTPEEIDRIQAYFGELFSRFTNDEIVDEAYRRHIVLQTFNKPRDILANPQLEARGFWQDVAHDLPEVTVRYPGRFCLFTGAADAPLRRAPHLGEHNREIFMELGIGAEDLAQLKREGVV